MSYQKFNNMVIFFNTIHNFIELLTMYSVMKVAKKIPTWPMRLEKARPLVRRVVGNNSGVYTNTICSGNEIAQEFCHSNK